MNQQEHVIKEILKKIVKESPNYPEDIKRDIIMIIDAGNTAEEIFAATLDYFMSRNY